MSFMDKLLNTMRFNDDDDDDFDFDNEDYDFEEEEEVKPKKKSSVRDKYVDTYKKEEEEVKIKPVQKITPIAKQTPRKQGVGMEVCVIKPTSIEEEVEIVDTLLNGRTVVINMEGLNIEIAQRIIDFTSGATYSMHGNLQKISNYIFLATPNGVDISGDITNLMDSFDLPGVSI